MAKIEAIPEAQALVESARGPAGTRVRQAIEALRGLEPGQSLRIEPGTGRGESIAAWRRAFILAGRYLQLELLLFRGSGGKLYVEARPAIIAMIDAAAAQSVSEEPLTVEDIRQGIAQLEAATAEPAHGELVEPGATPYDGSDWRDIAQGAALSLPTAHATSGVVSTCPHAKTETRKNGKHYCLECGQRVVRSRE